MREGREGGEGKERERKGSACYKVQGPRILPYVCILYHHEEHKKSGVIGELREKVERQRIGASTFRELDPWRTR